MLDRRTAAPPDSADYASDLAMTYSQLADLHEALDEVDQAARNAERCCEVLQDMRVRGMYLDERLRQLWLRFGCDRDQGDSEQRQV